MDGAVADALADAFPRRSVTAVSEAGPSWNDGNRTVEARFEDGRRAFLKAAVDGDAAKVERERAAIGYVDAHAAVPVPSVVAAATADPVPYLATAPMTGGTLASLWADAAADERAALAREVGRGLARVHDCRFETHGRIVGGGAAGLDLDPGSWTDVLAATISEMRAMAPCDRYDHHFEAVSDAVEANRGRLDRAPAALLHGDPAGPNCVRTEAGVGFLDWERAHVGDPARDVYRALSQQFGGLREDPPDALAAALLDGYRSVAGSLPAGHEERRPVYEAVRLLGTSGYFDRVAAFHDEPREELAAWVEAEMRRRLDTVR